MRITYTALIILVVISVFSSCKNDKDTGKTTETLKAKSTLVDTTVALEKKVDTVSIEKVVSNDTLPPANLPKTQKSIEDMQTLFTTMFDNTKEEKKYYTLNDIKFDKNSHKISYFTKEEVVGLAEALKGRASKKIEIIVFTNDADSSRKNKKLSKSRAQLVTQMLETLGVNKKQLKAIGKGNSDLEKAKQNRVEIEVK